ncbi:MAG TPA: hypothetical protein VFT95_09735 [Micromonosporaceae bacterium]|nr:hypothetical protein [Micromonosporaceae bacterium]
MAETTPERLVAALTAAGWFEVGRREGVYVRLQFADRLPLLVPLNPANADYEDLMAEVLAELETAADYGSAAELAHTLATCSCGGKRWVDDEGWSPPDWAMAVKPVREPGRGLLPCGNCNHGGWNVPVGDGDD